MNAETAILKMEHGVTGHGEPLVLVPGGLTGWLSWVAHAEALSASRQVIRVQLLSVGLSGEPLPSDYSVNSEVTALGNTLDNLGIKQADIAGWSYGGSVALSYAIHHPQRVRTLTLIEPAAYWVLRARGPLSPAFLEEQRFMESLSAEEVTEVQLIHFVHMAGLVPEAIDPRTLPQWPLWSRHRQSLRIGGSPFLYEDSLELLRNFEKPVLLVKGEGSSPLPHHTINILAEELPNAQVVSFPGGHAAHIVSMQPFMDAFIRFMSEHRL